MKNIYLTFVALFFSLLLTAQSKADYVTTRNGLPYAISGVDFYIENSGKLPSGKILLVNNNRKKITLSQIETNLNIQNEVDIVCEVGGEKAEFYGSWVKGEMLYIFLSTIDKEKNIKTLWVQEYEGETLKSNGAPKKLLQNNFGEHSKGNSGDYILQLNKSQDKLLVVELLPYEKNAPEAFTMHVYNTDFEELWSREITLETRDKDVTLQSYEIDNLGNIFLIYKDYSDLKYGYYVESYSNEGQDIGQYKVDVNGLYITDLSFFSKDGKCNVAGFYSEKKNIATGAFYARLNSTTGEIEASSSSKFSIEFLTEDLSDAKSKQVKKKSDKGKDVGLTQNYIYDLLDLKNGSQALIGEQFYTKTVTTTSTSNGVTTTTTTIHYYHMSIFVINIDSEGQITWSIKIPKYQHTANSDYFSGFTYMVIGSDVYFIYNDHINNLTPGSKKTFPAPFFKKNGITTIAHVNAEGELNRKILFNYADSKKVAVPLQSFIISDNELLLFLQKGKKRMNTVVSIDNN